MQKLQVQFVFEVLGRPAKEIAEALQLLVKKIEGEKGIRIFERKFHEVVPVKDGKDLFTTFAEITAELDSIEYLLPLLMAYMPSHAEVIYPENVELTNQDLNQFANQLLQRLHHYDAVTKNVLAEREILVRELKTRAPELFAKTPAPATVSPPLKSSKKNSKKSASKKKKK